MQEAGVGCAVGVNADRIVNQGRKGIIDRDYKDPWVA